MMVGGAFHCPNSPAEIAPTSCSLHPKITSAPTLCTQRFPCPLPSPPRNHPILSTCWVRSCPTLLTPQVSPFLFASYQGHICPNQLASKGHSSPFPVHPAPLPPRE